MAGAGIGKAPPDSSNRCCALTSKPPQVKSSLAATMVNMSVVEL